MQVAIADTYGRLAAATSSKITPVGAGLWIALSERPDIDLYQPDGSHPSPAGTFLAASVKAGALIDVDPLDFEDDRGLNVDTAASLRQFASRAMAGEPWGLS